MHRASQNLRAERRHLYCLYGGGAQFFAVFPPASLACWNGYRLPGGTGGVSADQLGAGRGVRGAGAQKMTWAYVLSGGIALALLVYLVAALIRAEDL